MAADPLDIDLIDRYLAGTATPDENAIVEGWLARNDEHTRVVEALRAQFGVRAVEPSNAASVWRRLFARIRPASVPTRPQLTIVQGRRSSRRLLAVTPTQTWWLIPAVVGGAAAAVFALYSGRQPVVPPQPGAAPPKEYASAKGQRAELRLPDGTRVVLAPDSRLVVPASYDSTDRSVTLEGQAYFDVVHRDKQPFLVHAGVALIKDIGTRFDVRAFPNEQSIRVVVTHGEVRLGRSSGPETSARSLVAGTLGRISGRGQPTVVRVDTAGFVSWTRGVLVFDRTPLREAMVELSRWYDVDIRMRDTSLANLTLTATFPDYSLAEVLDLVALTTKARVERSGRSIVLSSGG